MNSDIQSIVLSEKQIAEKVEKAAKWLDAKFEGTQSVPLMISVLKGSVMFFCDLVRAMDTPVQIDFMTVSSYGSSSESSGMTINSIKFLINVLFPVRTGPTTPRYISPPVLLFISSYTLYPLSIKKPPCSTVTVYARGVFICQLISLLFFSLPFCRKKPSR